LLQALEVAWEDMEQCYQRQHAVKAVVTTIFCNIRAQEARGSIAAAEAHAASVRQVR
jgi:hypothetical protein